VRLRRVPPAGSRRPPAVARIAERLGQKVRRKRGLRSGFEQDGTPHRQGCKQLGGGGQHRGLPRDDRDHDAKGLATAGDILSDRERKCVAVIGVDPAYTSRWGAQHWRQPLQQQTSDPAAVTVHHGAAAAIGRRGLGLAIRRRPAGPRTQQRTRVGTPPARPDKPPSTTPRRCESSGSPPRPQRRPGVAVRQITPTASGQHRSGRTGLTPDQ
jgi:hypothetical protein